MEAEERVDPGPRVGGGLGVRTGVQHLLVRSRKIRIFGGIDIQTDAGWAELKAAIRGMAETMFGAAPEAAAKPRPPRAKGR